MNPVMFPQRQKYTRQRAVSIHSSIGISTSLIASALVLVAAATSHWAQRWLVSGSGVLSLLLFYGASSGARILPDIPLWTLLATLNLTYAICSTSWLLYILFAISLLPCILLTCLFQFSFVADFARKNLRTLLKQLHFTRDKIALFNLPALEINTTVDGLFVIRGVTIQLSTLTLIAHGIELGMKLTRDVEMAAHVDEVTIRLFRDIEVGDVLANVKGGSEITLADIQDDSDEIYDDDSIFENNTPLLRAATAGSEGFKDRPQLRASLTGTSYVKDTSAEDGLETITTLSPDDAVADRQYREILDEIRRSSAIYQCRVSARNKAQANGSELTDENELRAAICAEMHDLPSVPHPPSRSVKVTTLQNLSSPATRRFLHRLPFLLRLLLMILSYFHTISFSSINAAGSGKWFKALLKQQVFRDHAESNAEIRRLERRISAWLNDANFCVQLADISAQAYIPLSTDYNIMAQLRLNDLIAYRATPESGAIVQVIRLGGADATFAIPSFLLPHHEHILPPEPSKAEKVEVIETARASNDKIEAMQAEQVSERVIKDEAVVSMSVHGSLPAALDQSLLNFAAAVVKATKVIEFEKEVEKEVSVGNGADQVSANDHERASSPTRSIDSLDTASTVESPTKTTKFKAFSRRTFQSLADGTTKNNFREMTRDFHQATREGFKKVAIAGMVNDRWIAKMVGRIAAKLEQAQGDLGYSSDIPVALGPYRPSPRLAAKLLP